MRSPIKRRIRFAQVPRWFKARWRIGRVVDARDVGTKVRDAANVFVVTADSDERAERFLEYFLEHGVQLDPHSEPEGRHVYCFYAVPKS